MPRLVWASAVAQVEQLSMSLHEIQKGSHKHFMLKEILEQPEVRFPRAASTPRFPPPPPPYSTCAWALLSAVIDPVPSMPLTAHRPAPFR